MPTIREIVVFQDDEPPPGASPWVIPPRSQQIEMEPYDESWPATFDAFAALVRRALGARALDVVHVGSTSVPGLPAKPIVDVDVIVADPSREDAWLPPLEEAGFVLTVREPWWHEHRLLKFPGPAANVHVFGPDAPEPWKHRIFRDHLRADEHDRELYAKAKARAAASSNGVGETVMDYNRRKEEVIREIYARAFVAAGLVNGE